MSEETINTNNNQETQVQTERTVPYSKFSAARQERKQYLDQVTALTDQINEMKGSLERYTQLETDYNNLKSEFDIARAHWDTETSLMSNGLMDSESRDLARFLHGRLPEENKPDLSTWVSAWKSDPDLTPLAMRPYLNQSVNQSQPPRLPVKPDSNRGVVNNSSPSGQVQYTEQRIRELRSNPAEYKKHRQAILDSLKNR